MKKVTLFLLMASVVLFSSCATGVGAVLGGALGSAIGGVSGGPRGHDVGLLVGAATGAMLGAAVDASTADKQAQQQAQQQAESQRQYEQEKARLAANRAARERERGYNSDYSTDDRVDIDFGDNSDFESVTIENENYVGGPRIEIRNVRFIDSDGTNTISRGEQCSIAFELYNASDQTVYDIEPYVTERSNNSHISISPSILIESLAAQKGVKYTARLVADNSLRDGSAYFTINVDVDGERVGEGVSFSIPTSKN